MDESSESPECSAPPLLRIDRPVNGRLAHLHLRSIAVRFQAQGEDRLLFGQGLWENDPQLGAILHIHFPQHPDDGEFLVFESEWSGEIEPGEPDGCDFVIRLG